MNEEGTWQTLLRRKYLGNKPLTQVTKQPGDSQFWSGLMEIKDQFFERGKFVVQNGLQTRFWEDLVIDDNTIKASIKFAKIYKLNHLHLLGCLPPSNDGLASP